MNAPRPEHRPLLPSPAPRRDAPSSGRGRRAARRPPAPTRPPARPTPAPAGGARQGAPRPRAHAPTTTQSGRGRLAGKIGGGGSAVVLTTSHGDVRLRGASAVAQKTP